MHPASHSSFSSLLPYSLLEQQLPFCGHNAGEWAKAFGLGIRFKSDTRSLRTRVWKSKFVPYCRSSSRLVYRVTVIPSGTCHDSGVGSHSCRSVSTVFVSRTFLRAQADIGITPENVDIQVHGTHSGPCHARHRQLFIRAGIPETEVFYGDPL